MLVQFMNKQKAVIFDINGVLWGLTSPEKRAMREFGIDYTDEIHKKVQIAVCGTIFTDWPSYLSGFVKSLSIGDNWDNKSKLCHINFSELERAITEIPEGTGEILEGLKDKNYKLAAVSNCYPPTESFLNAAGIAQYMDVLFLSYQNGITKQNPVIYLEALRRLQVNAENAIMIGDNLYDDIIQSKKATSGKIGGIFINLKKEPFRTDSYNFFVVDNLKQVPETIEEYFVNKL